jgi:hypothetical protein
MPKNGWMLWLRARNDDVRVVFVAIADPIQAREAALQWLGGGTVEAYEEVPGSQLKALAMEEGQVMDTLDL